MHFSKDNYVHVWIKFNADTLSISNCESEARILYLLTESIYWVIIGLYNTPIHISQLEIIELCDIRKPAYESYTT